MALVENTLSEISEELKQLRSKNEAKESPSAAHVRRERNANPTTVTLADLTKRIIALESRSSFRGKWKFFSFYISIFSFIIFVYTAEAIAQPPIPLMIELFV